MADQPRQRRVRGASALPGTLGSCLSTPAPENEQGKRGKEHIHRATKVILAACVATGMLLTVGAGTALAANPTFHATSTISGDNLYPAGTLCNFTLHDTFTAEIT